MSIVALSVVLGGFLAELFLLLIVKRLSIKYKILSPKGIPHMGGPALAIVFLSVVILGFSFYGGIPKEIIGIFIASFLMLLFGVIDDWHELSVAKKLFVQILASLLLISFGIKTQIVNIGNLLNIIITLIWFLAITNAFNHLDVSDGVAAGSALIISLAFFLISFLHQDTRAIILCLALIGVLSGFLVFNLPPASIYMGNSGSHFLGILLAAIAIVISYAPMERKVALLSPILILGFPIFDTAFLVLMRLGKRKLPFKKSNDHLVLRFLASGYNRKKALSVMLFWNLFFACAGIVISMVTNLWGIVTIAVVFLASLILTVKMSKVVING